jgi:large subunit ribosomal protein L22
MQVQAITKYVRISPQKANEVARIIRGMNAAAALDTLQFVPRKAARIIRKTLHSAVANAEYEAKKEGVALDVNDLVVKSAEVGSGPVIKRWQAVARGSAHPILKRTSHIKVVVSDQVNGAKSKAKAAKKAAQTAAPKAAKTGAKAAQKTEPAKPEEKKA